MNPKNHPLHRYMLTFQAVFRGPEGQAGMKTVNSVIARNKKTMPLGIIKQAQDGVAVQLQMFGIDPSNIVDVSLLACSYLGLMTDTEFTAGLSNDEAASVSLDGQDDEAPASELGEDPTNLN